MTMTPSVRKFALTAHVASSVGVLGAIGAFLVLAITGLNNQDTSVIRATYLSMDLLARLVIVPLAFASLLSGFIQSLGTPWGLVRHYWIVAKLVISSFASAVLLAKLRLIGYAASLALEVEPPIAELRAVGTELAVHAAGGLLVLLIPTALSIYKPRGLTAYGLSKQREDMQKSSVQQLPFPLPASVVSDPRGGTMTFTLRRSQVIGSVVVILILHVLVLHAVGGGPMH